MAIMYPELFTGVPRITREALPMVLSSQNQLAIQQIPLLNPLGDKEIGELIEWGKRWIIDPSWKDFVLISLVRCGIPFRQIFCIIKENSVREFQSPYFHNILQGEHTDDFLPAVRQMAEGFAGAPIPATRDRGRHILMMLTQTPDEWKLLAIGLSNQEVFSDLRQKVLIHFLQECPDGEYLTFFCKEIAQRCKDVLVLYKRKHFYGDEITKMHWLLMCADRLGDKNAITQAIFFLKQTFGFSSLPRDLRKRISLFDQPSSNSR